ncbi:hypothetical protein RhiirA1_476192 [Rhizophagus irregularis]|uniref:Endonuclease/exonuclease/phosphatase domain-containing protein n=1 Tax=Rhizophagus irregularis TaxID=588596 RepID=A0A2N0QVJ6_9GLOM|nr:hypothetical protein RhiirA1_476192 [Rhizophagus irregularis]
MTVSIRIQTLDREFSSFSSYGSKATTQGSGDTKIIVVYFRSKPDMEKAIAAPIASLHNLQFHEHDPSAKKVDEQLRTLVVTDIPLFVTDAQLRGTFSRYGIAVLCTGHCLRVCPASHSPDQRAIRRAHVALLAGLPRGSVAADLSEIAKEVSAKSVNIPFSYNSYNPKPYPYVHFSFAATKESAMGITCALKSTGLTWHEPTEVSSLCHRCGRPGCNPDKCASSRAPQRPSRPWSSNDKLRELYNKHLPPSHPAKRHNRFARPANSEQRSYADAAGRRAPSRSQSRPRSLRSRSQYNNRRQPHRPSQSELDHDIAAMDIPPLMDWQYITEQISIILEEITHLTTEFAQLQNRVKCNDTPDSRRLSDNLMDFSSPASPPSGPNFIAQSHISLSPRMSLIPGPAASPQDRLSSLTATVTELTKCVVMMDNNKHKFSPHRSPLIKFGQINVNDLFFHQTKIFIISLYYPPSGSVHQSICNDLITKLLSWLDHACTNNYFVIILGNFNIDEVAHSNYSSNHFKLLRLLSSRVFTDHQAHSSSDGPDPTFYYTNRSSRLDYIWSSPGFPAPGLFSQVVTCPNLLDRPFTDHKVLITLFDFSSCLAILAKSRLKQRKEMRTIFFYTSTSIEQWNNFTTEVDDSLGVYLDRQYNSRLNFSSLSLDRMWHALKAAIFSAAIETLPFQKKNLVSAFLSTKFAQHLTDSVEFYIALRDEHFSNSLGTFIDSALSVEKRLIVFDRVLVVLDSTSTFLTDPLEIKQAAIAHFQSIVSPPLVHYSSIASFSARWQQAYTPLADVSASLYDPVLAPISLQEWSSVISSMPNNKASGPSKISYEMIKHLSGDALGFSLLLANICLYRGDIPADWREAVVYPIPKPHDFDAQLKNT